MSCQWEENVFESSTKGVVRGIALLKARTGGKLTVHIPNGSTGGDDKASSCSQVILMRSFDSMSHFRQEKMEALQLQHESEGKSYTEVEIFAEVLGTKAGYVRV
ncbi:hypothetical protein CJ030_MR4G027170 [Morella rubra]|uniref:Uncharacterized protein n=1 Tax=Morella rubra TaxID=262757 RepID=A0A6A1VT30_9ROSI|nr:hypothetical protein CJ030_MR4G027170 [Morella rubra]